MGAVFQAVVDPLNEDRPPVSVLADAMIAYVDGTVTMQQLVEAEYPFGQRLFVLTPEAIADLESKKTSSIAKLTSLVGEIASTGIPIETATAIARATFSSSIQSAVRRLGLNQQIDPSSPLWLSETEFDGVFG